MEKIKTETFAYLQFPGCSIQEVYIRKRVTGYFSDNRYMVEIKPGDPKTAMVVTEKNLSPMTI